RAQQQRHQPCGLRAGGHYFGDVAYAEIIFVAGLDPVPLAQQSFDFVLDVRNIVGARDAQRDLLHGARRYRRCAGQPAARGFQWHQHDVVLVLAETALSLRLEDAGDGERHAADAHRLPDRILIAKQLAPHRLTEDHGLAAVVVAGLECIAIPDFPAIDGEEIRLHALPLRRPVVFRVHDLGAATEHRGDVLDFRDLVADRFRIGFIQGVTAARGDARATA